MTTPLPDPATVTDLWGVVVPAWLGAVGTIAASVVAVVALVKGQSASKGVKNIAHGLNVEAENATAEAKDDKTGAEALDQMDRIKEFIANAPLVSWRLSKHSKHQFALLNESRAITAHVSEVNDISEGHRDALTLTTVVPIDIGPGSMLPFNIERSLASPAVTAVEVIWTEGPDDRERRAVFYI